jgi:hypothetical protein
MPDLDDAIIAEILGDEEGAVTLQWEVASRCSCITADTKQPRWECPLCAGSGVAYANPQSITGLFRSQSRWLSFRREGEFDHGEASLTTALSIRPGYTDRRVRDRFTTTAVSPDVAEGRVFYPAAPAVPFIFAGAQRAWRVQLQSAELAQQLAT